MTKKKKISKEAIKKNNQVALEWYKKEMKLNSFRYDTRHTRAIDFGKGIIVCSAIGFLLDRADLFGYLVFSLFVGILFIIIGDIE